MRDEKSLTHNKRPSDNWLSEYRLSSKSRDHFSINVRKLKLKLFGVDIGRELQLYL